MKTYFLDNINSRDLAVDTLRSLLPGQENPWLLTDHKGDPIAYFNLVHRAEDSERFSIDADLSGRHYHRGSEVVEVLERLQEQVGGVLGSDD